MKANKRNALALFGAAALLTGPLWVSPAAAQGPGGGFGGPGGGFGGPGGGFGGGGQGGFNRRPPFAYGTVSAVDAGAGTVTISSRSGGGDQVIQTQGTTQIVSQTTAKVSDLKKGDKVEVSGMPTQMTADSLAIGDSPLASLGGPGGPGGPPPGAPGGGNAGGGPSPANTRVTGTVTSTSPLTIALSPTASLTLKMDPSAKVTKFMPVALSAIKPGDKVVGIGTANGDGSFAATTLAVNTDLGAMGRGYGRRGGFGGPGGQGGPGGFGGPGGQGGPRGQGMGGRGMGGRGMGQPDMPPSRGMGGADVPPSRGMDDPSAPGDMPPPPGQ